MAKTPPEVQPPSNWPIVKKLRQENNKKLNSCKYLRPDISLRDYQHTGALNFLLNRNMILGDGAGLGKSLQALAAFCVWKEKDPSAKLLVVTVKASAPQWGEEMQKFTRGLTWHVMTSEGYKPEGERRKLQGLASRDAQYRDFKDVDVLVCHYHTAREDFDQIAETREPNFMVVFDECQEFKNHKSMNYQMAYTIASKASRKYGMSATPIKNRLVEFYYLFSVIVPGLFPGITRWKDTYTIQELQMRPQRGGKPRMVKEVVGYKNLHQFKDKIEPFFLVRRTKDVAKELPSLISKRAEVGMTGPQKKLYAEAKSGVVYQKRLREKYFNALEELQATEEPTKAQIKKFEELRERFEDINTQDGQLSAKMAALLYCQMVANGPGWIDEDGKSEKVEEFQRLMEDELAGENVIVFTRFESGIKYLQEVCDKVGRKWVRITGKEGDTQRIDARQKFQDPQDPTDVMFITAAGAASLNLQSASVVLFFDTPWSFGDLYQIIGRAQRIGSKHETILVMHMVTKGSIDEHVLALLTSKKDLNDLVVGDIAEGALDFNSEEVAHLSKGVEDALYRSIFGE